MRKASRHPPLTSSMANSGCLLLSGSRMLPHSLQCPPAFLYLQEVRRSPRLSSLIVCRAFSVSVCGCTSNATGSRRSGAICVLFCSCVVPFNLRPTRSLRSEDISGDTHIAYADQTRGPQSKRGPRSRFVWPEGA